MFFRFSNFSLFYKSYISRIASSSCSSSRLTCRSSFNYLISPLNSVSQCDHFVFSNNSHQNISRRWHFGHSHQDHHDDPQSSKHGEHVFRLGLTADIGLATGKALTGYLSGSTAIIADAAHSISDVVLSGVALWSFKVARTPKDKEHPYGHGKFETLGALGISCMLVATAGGIAWHALNILTELFASTPEMVNNSGHHHGIDMDHPILALNMTIVSIAVKEGLFWITKRAGEKEGSGLMKANAWHHRADAISSFVALIGVGGSILGVKFLDPLAGLVVSGMILKAGIQNGYESVMELVDAGVPSSLLDPIRRTILQVEGVMGCHRLRGRKAGSSMHLDVHIEVDPFLSVSAAHDIGENVRRQVQKCHFEVAEVFIHIDPAISQLPHSIPEQEGNLKGTGCQTLNVFAEQKEIEALVSDAILSKFSEKMAVERITHHVFQGKLFLQIEVSMSPEMLIRDAMEFAKEAEKEVLRAASNISQVNILLRLGHPVPLLHNSQLGCNKEDSKM